MTWFQGGFYQLSTYHFIIHLVAYTELDIEWIAQVILSNASMLKPQRLSTF